MWIRGAIRRPDNLDRRNASLDFYQIDVSANWNWAEGWETNWQQILYRSEANCLHRYSFWWNWFPCKWNLWMKLKHGLWVKLRIYNCQRRILSTLTFKGFQTLATSRFEVRCRSPSSLYHIACEGDFWIVMMMSKNYVFDWIGSFLYLK